MDDFRKEMLNDNRIRKIVDFEDANECFPGVDMQVASAISFGKGIHHGPCEVVNIHNEAKTVSTRSLNEFETFIRHSQAVPIIRKVLEKQEEECMSKFHLSKPFGLRTFAKTSKNG